jgi:outer membrane protein insertion porin family
MNSRLAKPVRLLALGLLLAIALPPHPVARAQEGSVVRAIEIQYVGPASVSKERILANMRTAVGKPYASQVAEEDIRNLYAAGGISNLRIFSEPAADGVKVVVVVQTRATVKAVTLQGVESAKEGRIRKELSVKPGDSLNESALEQDRQKIVDYYVKKGFGDINVQYKVESDERAGTATVVFAVSEGGKQVIRSVRFQGNAGIEARDLQKVMKTRPRAIIIPFIRSGRINKEQLDQDVVAVEDLYRDRGFADARVTETRLDPAARGNRVDVVLVISEGDQYRLGKLAITGQQLFSEPELRAVLKLAEGGIYGPAGLRADVKALNNLYGAKGYVDMQVIPETSPGGKGIVNLTFRIEEGAQSYVQRVNIEGNTKTKDKVLRRELAVAPGDVFNTVLVEASRQRLINLNYFSKVDLYPAETMVPGRKDLNVQVEEKRTGAFNFGAGFSSIDSFIGFAELQQSNFDIMRWPNFTGGGQRFRVRAQYGDKRQDFIIGLTEPWFLDRKLAVGGEAFYRKATYTSDVYDQSNYGIAFNARKPLGDFVSIRGEYRIEEIEISNVDESASQTFQDAEGKDLKSAVSGVVTWDTRDNLFLTRKGHKVEGTLYTAGGVLGGDVETYGWNLEASKFFNLPWDTILQFVGELGVVDSMGDGEGVPIYDRLYLGGANTLRGFDFRDVGPKDEDGEPIGGQTLARFTAEYTFPIINKVRGAVFYDVGFVSADAYDWGGDVNSNFGVGARLDLPIGPVRLDFGVPIQSDEFNDGGGKFNFNVGYQF